MVSVVPVLLPPEPVLPELPLPEVTTTVPEQSTVPPGPEKVPVKTVLLAELGSTLTVPLSPTLPMWVIVAAVALILFQRTTTVPPTVIVLGLTDRVQAGESGIAVVVVAVVVAVWAWVKKGTSRTKEKINTKTSKKYREKETLFMFVYCNTESGDAYLSSLLKLQMPVIPFVVDCIVIVINLGCVSRTRRARSRVRSVRPYTCVRAHLCIDGAVI